MSLLQIVHFLNFSNKAIFIFHCQKKKQRLFWWLCINSKWSKNRGKKSSAAVCYCELYTEQMVRSHGRVISEAILTELPTREYGQF